MNTDRARRLALASVVAVVASVGSRAGAERAAPPTDESAQRRDYVTCIRQETRNTEESAMLVERCGRLLDQRDPSSRALISWVNARTYDAVPNHQAIAVRHALACVANADAAPPSDGMTRRRRECVALVRRHFRAVAWVRNTGSCNVEVPPPQRSAIAPVALVGRGSWTAVQPGSIDARLDCPSSEGPTTPRLAVTLVAGRRYEFSTTVTAER